MILMDKGIYLVEVFHMNVNMSHVEVTCCQYFVFSHHGLLTSQIHLFMLLYSIHILYRNDEYFIQK